MSSFTPPAPLSPLTKARSVDINNLSDAVAAAFAALPSDDDLNNGTVNFGIDSGTANNYIVTLPTAPTGYVDGLRVVFTPLNSNSGASTVNVNGLGVKAIRLQDNTATEPGTLVAGIPKTLIYGATLGNFFVEANSVTSAMAAAAAAAASASAASGSASAAATSASNAATSESNAQAYALAAQGTQVIATSTSSVLIGTGTKNFTTQAAKQFALNAPIIAVDQANPANYVSGSVLSYAGTALQIAVTDIGGSGTISAWNISISGVRGIQGIPGSTNAGNLNGALNELKGSDVASATTIDPWGSGGNYEVLTGTTLVTGFAAAPQAGSRRRMLAAAATPIQAGANMVIKGVQSGQTYTTSPGDEIDIVAETTTKFRITIIKGDGTAMAAMFGAFQCCITSETSGVFTARRTGWHRITLIGSPGRPGALNASNTTARATGAGAGGFCSDVRFLIAGVAYPYTVGAGTASTTINNGVTSNGVDGSASSFALAGSATLMANGGVAGAAQLTATAMTGGAGGTASGGAINVTGGAGGDVLGTNAGRAGSGGGAVGAQGLSPKGGSATPSASGNLCAAGGAGVGGDGGSVAGNATGGGGGAGGAASGATGGVDYAGKVSTAVATVGPATAALENATAGGQNGASAAFAQNGAGASGQNANTGFANSSPSPLAGGSATVYVTDANLVGGSVRPASSGGPGAIVANYTTSSITVPTGANGKIYFEF